MKKLESENNKQTPTISPILSFVHIPGTLMLFFLPALVSLFFPTNWMFYSLQFFIIAIILGTSFWETYQIIHSSETSREHQRIFFWKTMFVVLLLILYTIYMPMLFDFLLPSW